MRLKVNIIYIFRGLYIKETVNNVPIEIEKRFGKVEGSRMRRLNKELR